MPTSLTARHTWQPNTATPLRAPQARRQTRSSYAPRFIQRLISDEQLKRDITHWRKADTVETVIEDHHARHREMALMKNAQRDSSQTTRGLILCAKSLPKAAISTPRPILCAQGDDPLRHPRPLYPTTKSRGNLLALKCPLGWCHRYEILPLVHTRQQSRYDYSQPSAR